MKKKESGIMTVLLVCGVVIVVIFTIPVGIQFGKVVVALMVIADNILLNIDSSKMAIAEDISLTKIDVENFIVLGVPSPCYLEGYIEGQHSMTNSFAYPFKIQLMPYDTKDIKTLIIKNREDIPKHSVKTECPKSDKYKINKCWFVKYTDEDVDR